MTYSDIFIERLLQLFKKHGNNKESRETIVSALNAEFDMDKTADQIESLYYKVKDRMGLRIIKAPTFEYIRHEFYQFVDQAQRNAAGAIKYRALYQKMKRENFKLKKEVKELEKLRTALRMFEERQNAAKRRTARSMVIHS